MKPTDTDLKADQKPDPLPQTISLQYPINYGDQLIREVVLREIPCAMTWLAFEPSRWSYNDYLPALAAMTNLPEQFFRQLKSPDFMAVVTKAVQYFF